MSAAVRSRSSTGASACTGLFVEMFTRRCTASRHAVFTELLAGVYASVCKSLMT